MRTSLLKRFSAGVMAVATAATLLVGVNATPVEDEEFKDAGTFGGFAITGITVDGDELTGVTGDNDDSSGTGILEIEYGAMDEGDEIVIETTYTPATGEMLIAADATEVDEDGDPVPISDALFEVTPYFTFTKASEDAATKERKVSDIYADNQKAKTVTFTLTAKENIDAGTVYVKLDPTIADADYGMNDFAFWTSFASRRQLAKANISDNTITIYYNLDGPADLLKFETDTLPTITIGQLTPEAAGKTIYSADTTSYYSIATISESGKKVKLNGTEYTVNFVVAPLPKINANDLTKPTVKSKAAYSMTLSIGGADYTYNKDTDYSDLVNSGLVTTDGAGVTTITFNKVATLTGGGTITFKGAYLYADQSFSVQASALTKDGVKCTLVYKDGTTGVVVVKANGSSVTKSSEAYHEDSEKRYTVLIDGSASTKYPYATDKGNAGIDIVNINLVNDVIPETLQVKVESKFIAGGSVTLDVDYYHQVFPIQLTDGSYYYVSVNVSSLKNNLLPVTKFDFIGAASSNIDLRPLTIWDQSRPDLNKYLYIDYTGTLTDRVVYSGVLNDGTTDKIFPSTSYYQHNSDISSAYNFFVRWTEGQDLKGLSVKFTRPYVTFDIPDPTTGTLVTYTAVFIGSKQPIDATATNSTLGGQAEVSVDTGEYSTTWVQADAYTQYKRNKVTKTKGKINITSYYSGSVDLENDYVTLTLRLPKGVKLSMDTTSGDIKDFKVLQNFEGVAGNTTTDGLVDYVVQFKYRELYTGSNSVGASTLKVSYPMLTNQDGKDAGAYKEYDVVTKWVAKSYIAEKKVTMAGITVPSAIVAPSEPEQETSSVATSTTTSATSSQATSSQATSSQTSLPDNPKTGVPFNTLAYVVTIAASAIGGVSTMVIRKK